jgi:hypothetical protein
MGVSVQELSSTDPEFLLACLVSQADPQPWHGLDWIAAQESEDGFHTGLLTEQDGRRIVAPFLTALDQQERPTLEALTFCVMNYPDLFSAADRDRVLDAWAKSFDELEDLAVEGLIIREQLKEFFAGAERLTVNIEVSGSPPAAYDHQWIPKTLPQMVLGVIRSCGVELREVREPSKADLQLKLHLSQIALYDYRRPNYSYEDYYEYRTSVTRLGVTWTQHTTKIKRSKQVLAGYSDETSYAPTATLQLTYHGRTLDLEPGLIYWHSLTFDHEKNAYRQFESESSWSRTWPLGIRDTLFEYHFMTDPDNARRD